MLYKYTIRHLRTVTPFGPRRAKQKGDPVLVQVPGTLDDFRRQTSQGMARELRLLPWFPGCQQHQAGGRPAKVVPFQQPCHPSDQGEDQARASGQQRGHCIQVLLGQVVMEQCWGMITTDLLPMNWG